MSSMNSLHPRREVKPGSEIMTFQVVPCAVLALCIHPTTSHNLLNRISWAFCVYLEAVSLLPQLRVMQNTKIVEPFTAHYVFALGVASL
ncbi:uncharacterized protein LOC128036078 [Gossypium raimondii]|uniref:uncharacterized protein LOC128036078 n=1 Tax=Gossypium raimondii TaxID=29730 RepID=UPI00227A58ED|nr:uncharacterized protein LOC128036078 [Gossypium raimondii]